MDHIQNLVVLPVKSTLHQLRERFIRDLIIFRTLKKHPYAIFALVACYDHDGNLRLMQQFRYYSHGKERFPV
jgi:hypothetical protein